MYGKIVEVLREEKSPDGKTSITSIMIPDGDLRGVSDHYAVQLEKVIEQTKKEGQIKQKLMRVISFLRREKFEVSPTFFEPTLIEVPLKEGTVLYATIKPKGIARPFFRDFITEKTMHLYLHESGILGFLEKDKGLYRITKIPLRVVERLGLAVISETYPHIEDGIGIGSFAGADSSNIYSDGDLSYEESILIDPEKKWDDFVELWKNFIHKIQDAVNLAPRQYQRKPHEMAYFGAAGDVKDYLQEIAHTPWDVMIEVVPYPIIATENGVMARLYAETSKPGMLRQVLEMRIPLDIIRYLKKGDRKTGIERVDNFLVLHNLRPGQYDVQTELSSTENDVTYTTKFTGDITHRRPAQDKREYADLKRKIDTLGSQYLEKRMKHLRVFGE